MGTADEFWVYTGLVDWLGKSSTASGSRLRSKVGPRLKLRLQDFF